jgi:hypothetical protein
MAAQWDWKSWRESEDYSDQARKGLKVFGVATIVQLCVGLWFFLSLPASAMKGLLGGDLLKTALLFLAILPALGAVGTAFRGRVRSTVGLAFLAVLLMVITRYNVRSLYLEPYFSPSQLKLSPQYGVLALFLLVLLAGIAAIIYLVRISFPSRSTRRDSVGDVRLQAGGGR